MITKLRKILCLVSLIAAFLSVGIVTGKNTGEVQKERLSGFPPWGAEK